MSSLATAIVILIIIVVAGTTFSICYSRTHTMCWTQTGRSLAAALPQCAWNDVAHIRGGRLFIRDSNGAQCANIPLQHTTNKSIRDSGVLAAAAETCFGSPCSWSYHGVGEFTCRPRGSHRYYSSEHFEPITWDVRSN
jgi:hypothetical protein